MSVSKFSLLCLPEPACRHVFRIMNMVELFTLSLCSKSSKTMVQSLHIPPAREITLIFHNSISILTRPFQLRLMFSCDKDGTLERGKDLIKLDQPVTASILSQDLTVECKQPKLYFRQWISHFLDFFHKNQIDIIGPCETFHKYDYRFFSRALDGLHKGVIGIWRDCSNEVNLAVIESFAPINVLGLAKNPYNDLASFQRLIFQNFNGLDLQCQVSLDELLLINVYSLDVDGYSVKDVNRFLKLWSKKSLNRLEYLRFEFPLGIVPEKDVVFKGIQYTTAPDKRDLILVNKRTMRKDRVVGGYDIRSKNGKIATVTFRNNTGKNWIDMIVWT